MEQGATYEYGEQPPPPYHGQEGEYPPHPPSFPEPDKLAEEEEEQATSHDEEEPTSGEPRNNLRDKENEREKLMQPSAEMEDVTDPVVIAQNQTIAQGTPTTELEIALSESLKRKTEHIARLTNEVLKLKAFISKRKQTYKRKRKEDGAPIRALSAYNLFIRDRFAQLSKENEKALLSADTDAKLKRVPPSSLISSTGNAWKELSAEEKAKYEERAKVDRKRYEEQMAEYQPPDKQANRKRNKTGYNMFFSAHVLRLKQTESGVPSERGSVARLVGTAWKQLSAEDKAYYERKADEHNGMQSTNKEEDEDDEDQAKGQPAVEYHNYPHPDVHMHHNMPMHQGNYDHRHHHSYYAPHMYGPPPPYGYDYSQHHQRHQQARAQGYQQQGYPPPPRHGGYDG